MGRLREVCGAVSGMFMVVGMKYGYTDPTDKSKKSEHYKLIQSLAKQFENKNKSITCRELFREFVSRFALLSNDKIYTADWLASRSVKSYSGEGITPEALTGYLKAIDYDEFKDEYLAISGNLNKMTTPDGRSQSKREQLAPYAPVYYGIDGFVTELVDDTTLSLWMNQFLYDHANNRRGRSITECNVVNLVKELDIERTSFEKADIQQIYTREQIDAIYSHDQKLVNAAFVSASALLADGKIFAAEWLMKHDIGHYKYEGITADMLAKYLERLDSEKLGTLSDHISSALKKMRQ